MRIALLSDIHGNLEALASVVEDLKLSVLLLIFFIF